MLRRVDRPTMWNTPENIIRMPSSTLITTSDPVGRKATMTPRIRVARPIRKDAFQLCSRQGAESDSDVLSGTFGFHVFRLSWTIWRQNSLCRGRCLIPSG